jgi:predicted double-glycine peptidase
MASESLLERFPALKSLSAGRRLRRIPWVRQTAATDCGAACLAMVLAYHGKPAREAQAEIMVLAQANTL